MQVQKTSQEGWIEVVEVAKCKQNMKLEMNMHINPTIWEMRAASLKVIYVICFLQLRCENSFEEAQGIMDSERNVAMTGACRKLKNTATSLRTSFLSDGALTKNNNEILWLYKICPSKIYSIIMFIMFVRIMNSSSSSSSSSPTATLHPSGSSIQKHSFQSCQVTLM